MRETKTMTGKVKKKTILLVEDDPAVLSMLVKNLEYFGYEVIQAVDGMEGLKMLETGRYDLVITDIVMPYVSGVGVVSALKQKMPQIPVIAITGYGKEPETAALEKKADLVLAKPVKIAYLKEEIARLLGSSHKEEAP
ncbi:MAG: response regulator [Deltaproteobacteria bacterium]|nr:response regulator [Deltaproteobacteria bacterium]